VPLSPETLFNRLYSDVIEKGGVHLIGTKQVGKSNLKKSLSAFVMSKHPETKLIIIDSEGSWEFEFNGVQFYRIINGDVSISQEIVGEKLNGSNFYRTTYKIKRSVKQDIIKLLDSKEPVLFICEVEEPEEIAFFSAFVIEYVYNKQRIKRKYHRNHLKDSYFIVLEECENIFSSHSLDKTQLNKLRKKYNELANLRIGILSSSQRLTEVDKKFRAKMSGYLIGHILPEDFIGLIQRALKLHMGKESKKVTAPEFRYSFYYTGLNDTFKVEPFKQKGEPFEVPRTKPVRIKESEKSLSVRSEPRAKKSFFGKLKTFLHDIINFPYTEKRNERVLNAIRTESTKTQNRTQSKTQDSEPEEDLNPLLASNNSELDESLFSDESD
jgi:hypothetical protein